MKQNKKLEPIVNKKANFNFTTEETFEAGIILEGWEIKPILRRGVNFENSHVIVKNGELFLLNLMITPLQSTSTHEKAESTRTRKLLMHKKEINQLIGKVVEKGYTLIPLKIYQNDKRKIKVLLGLAKGKKLHDKRQSEKDADWKKEQSRLLKAINKE